VLRIALAYLEAARRIIPDLFGQQVQQARQGAVVIVERQVAKDQSGVLANPLLTHRSNVFEVLAGGVDVVNDDKSRAPIFGPLIPERQPGPWGVGEVGRGDLEHEGAIGNYSYVSSGHDTILPDSLSSRRSGGRFDGHGDSGGS